MFLAQNGRATLGVLEDQPSIVEPTAGPEPTEEILDTFEATGSGENKGSWTLAFRPSSLSLTLDDRTIVLTRTEVAEHARIMLFGDAGAVLVPPQWKGGLKMGEYARDGLREWMGSAMRDWGRSEAVLAARGSLPGAAVSLLLWLLDGPLFLLAFGVVSLLTALGRRFRPGSWLFLLAGANSAIVAIVFLVDVLWLGESWWWAIGIVWMVLLVHASVRKYRFFAVAQSPW